MVAWSRQLLQLFGVRTAVVKDEHQCCCLNMVIFSKFKNIPTPCAPMDGIVFNSSNWVRNSCLAGKFQDICYRLYGKCSLLCNYSFIHVHIIYSRHHNRPWDMEQVEVSIVQMCMDVCTIDSAVGHVRRLHGEKNRDSWVVFIIVFSNEYLKLCSTCDQMLTNCSRLRIKVNAI